jgi:hypothetical protein
MAASPLKADDFPLSGARLTLGSADDNRPCRRPAPSRLQDDAHTLAQECDFQMDAANSGKVKMHRNGVLGAYLQPQPIPRWSPGGPDPSKMTAEERLSEVGQIVTACIKRIFQRQLAGDRKMP